MNFTQSLNPTPSTTGDDPLGWREMTSVKAMVVWIAHEKKCGHEENIKCRLSAEFNVSDITEIKQRDYDRAMKFLFVMSDWPSSSLPVN